LAPSSLENFGSEIPFEPKLPPKPEFWCNAPTAVFAIIEPLLFVTVAVSLQEEAIKGIEGMKRDRSLTKDHDPYCLTIKERL
jgi:hypothetical protein